MSRYETSRYCCLKAFVNAYQALFLLTLMFCIFYIFSEFFTIQLKSKHELRLLKKDAIRNSLRSEINLKKLRILGINESIGNIKNLEMFGKFQEAFKDYEYFTNTRKVTKVSCKALFEYDTKERKKAQMIMDKEPRKEIPISDYKKWTDNCTEFVLKRGYIMSALTDIEREFPIAFSLMVYKSLEQVERLLRAVYRPQNYYCIHIDTKADLNFQLALGKVARCLPNVFLSTQSYNVTWGKISVMHAEMSCLTDLWDFNDWMYYINLAGEEFPLKTNYELVRILKAANGANFVTSQRKKRYLKRWKKAGIPPHNLTIIKGNLHVAVNRHFVDFVLHNKTSKDLLKWLSNTTVPDESFFSTLNHNPQLGIPGSYKGEPENDSVKPIITRFINWDYLEKWKCHGKIVRELCVFGVGDLWTLQNRVEMFANKFYWDYQYFALDCMEELMFNRTRDEYFGLMQFDSRFYEGLGTIKLMI